jgi:DNA-binding MarR family transcriptional regulator
MPKSTSPATPLEERLSYRCSLIAARITRFIAPMWEQHYGLTTVMWRVMAVVGRYGPLSAKEVAKHTSTDAFFVSRALEQLLEKKYVQRGVDPLDRRRASLELTAAGKVVHAKVEAALNEVEAQMVAGMNPRERQALTKALDLLGKKALALQESDKSWEDFCDPLEK